MRVFVAFDGSCKPFDVSQDETVSAIKQTVKEYFHVQLSDDKQARRFLELRYAGATLQDSWALADVGIAPGSTIRCLLKEENEAVLYVFNAVTRENLSIMGTVFLLSSPVSELKSLVSLQCGLPVSTFRLTTQSGRELYNCNRMDDYAIDVGATLRLDTWDGWVEFLQGCFHGHRHTVQRHLSEERPVLRFQQRVALYVAAFLGHLDLCGWLVERGVRAEEPVGVHPYREWCHETDHPDAAKCPVHAAAEAGRLLVLRLFLGSSVLPLVCRDPAGRDPLRIAVRHGHRECVSHLAAKLLCVVSFPGLALPMRVYARVKLWLRNAQQRKVAPGSLTRRGPFRTRVGDIVLVDGFTLPEMSSKPRGGVARTWCAGVTSCAFPALTAGSGTSCPPRPPARPPAQNAPVRLPQLHPPAAGDTREAEGVGKRGRGRKWRQDILVDENSERNRNAWRSKVPLPPTSQDTNPRPLFVYASPNSSRILATSLESFSQCCGRTPRENAIYCLALASAFTEKPWLQQLGVARNLAKRSVQRAV